MSTPGPLVCPDCGHTTVRVASGPPWCPDCEWNLGGHEPIPGASRRRLLARLDRNAWRSDEREFAALTAGFPGRPGWTGRRVALVAGSAVLVLLPPLLLWAGISLVLHNVVLFLPAVVLVLVAVELRPRLPRSPIRSGHVSRADAGALFGLLDGLGAEAGASPIDELAVTADFNAACAVVGLRRRRVLVIGLPLWAALDPAGRRALLAHELGHLVNGDPAQRLLTQPALTTFGRLAAVLEPRGLRGRSLAQNLVAELVFRPLCRLFALLHLALVQLGRRDGRRAEYYADAIAARTAGTDALRAALTTMLAGASVQPALRTAAVTSADPNQWRAALAPVLSRAASAERSLQQRSIRRESGALATHPPLGRRLRILDAWPYVPAPALDAGAYERADEELAKRYVQLARDLRNRR